jgi:hypothetical protein
MVTNKVLCTKEDVLAFITKTFSKKELKNLIFINSTALLLVAPQVGRGTNRIQALVTNRVTFNALLKRFNFTGSLVSKNAREYADIDGDIRLRLSIFTGIGNTVSAGVSNSRHTVEVSHQIRAQSPWDLRISFLKKLKKKPKNQYLRRVIETLHQLVPKDLTEMIYATNRQAAVAAVDKLLDEYKKKD